MMHRRLFLNSTACGFGSLATASLLSQWATEPRVFANEIATSSGLHHPAKAKRVIFLFMQGGVSQVDSFDRKPLLEQRDGEMMEFDDAREFANKGTVGSKQRVMKSPWEFKQYGQTGRWVSDLFPKMAEHVDRMALIHSMHTEGVAHGPATLFLHSGSQNFIRHQGTPIGKAGESQLRIDYLNATGDSSSRSKLDQIQKLNRLQLDRRGNQDSELDAVIESYEMAWRMQSTAPELLDFTTESEETNRLYGLDQKETESYGRKCLLARRLCESGVRFVQVNYGDNSANPAWDQHSNLPKHADHARAVDQPIAGLMTDLARRGLLEDTLVWWGGEFGRAPYAQQNGTGRDHNPGGFTVWLAGGGIQPGIAYGQTDEFGHRAIHDKVHMHDLHATVLHLLGIDHEKLTFKHAGRDFRLTDVHGRVVHRIIS